MEEMSELSGTGYEGVCLCFKHRVGGGREVPHKSACYNKDSDLKS